MVSVGKIKISPETQIRNTVGHYNEFLFLTVNGNVTVGSKNYIKYLGVLVDKNLAWKYHTDAIAAKISKSIGLISKLRHSIPRHIMFYIHQTLIHPQLT